MQCIVVSKLSGANNAGAVVSMTPCLRSGSEDEAEILMLKYSLHFSGLEKAFLFRLWLKHVKCNQPHVRKCIQQNIWNWKEKALEWGLILKKNQEFLGFQFPILFGFLGQNYKRT